MGGGLKLLATKGMVMLNTILRSICIISGIIIGFMGATFIIHFIRMVYHF